MTVTQDGPSPSKTSDADWEQQGRPVSPMAYHQPIMRFMDNVPPRIKRRVRDMLQEAGVDQGMSVNATPEQRKMVMLRLERTYPGLCQQVDAWPKDKQGRPNLAARFAETLSEANLRASGPSPEQAVKITTAVQRSPASAPGGRTSAATSGLSTEPNAAPYVTCYCGRKGIMPLLPAEQTCERCGATWEILSFVVRGTPPPSAKSVVFGTRDHIEDAHTDYGRRADALDDQIDLSDEPY